MTQPQQQQIQIKANDEILKGEYANFTQISHTQSEVTMDFILMFPTNGIFPAQGHLRQRIIVSPGFFKNMIASMQTVLRAHEEKFGVVKPSDAPTTAPIGFDAQ